MDFPVATLRSVDLGVPDLAGAERFYVDVWGLTLAARQDGVTYLAAAGADHHVVALHQKSEPALLAVTFRARTDGDLARIAAAAESAGAEIVESASADPGPAGGTRIVIAAPGGGLIRVVHGDRQKPATVQDRPVPTRLAHVNINSRDVDGLAGFYERVLGFGLTDRSKMMAFLRTNADHHAIVLAEAPVDGLNHVAFLMPDLEAVMRGSGRMVDAGFPIGWGVGRHGPGDNVFAYFVDPAGIVIEYTAEVLQVDDSYRFRGPAEWTWPPGRTDHWGIAPPKPDHVKAAQIAVPFGPLPSGDRADG